MLSAEPILKTLVADQWHHIALTRAVHGSYRVFVNGQAALFYHDLTENLYDISLITSPILHWTGGIQTGTAFTGQLHGYRVTKGVDRYGVDNFSPPTMDVFPAYAVAV